MSLAFLQSLGPAEILIILFLLGAFVLWITAIISVAKRSDLPSSSKAIWIVALIITGFAAAIVYWIIRLATGKKGIPDIKTFNEN